MTEHAVLTAVANRPLICGGCGYDLRCADRRCPECGRRFDPNHTIDALIPWERRPHLRYIGRIGAYFSTVRLMTFQPGRVARYLDRPVSFSAARRFRRVTVFLGFFGALATGLICRAALAGPTNDLLWRDEPLLIVRNPWSLGVCVAGFLVGLSAATRLTAAFFDRAALPQPRRQRAAAIGQYACAPLGPAVALAVVIAIWCRMGPVAKGNEDSSVFEVLSSVLPPIAGALLWILSTIVLLRKITGCGLRRLLAAALLLPVAWLVCLVGIPIVAMVAVALAVVIKLSFP